MSSVCTRTSFLVRGLLTAASDVPFGVAYLRSNRALDSFDRALGFRPVISGGGTRGLLHSPFEILHSSFDLIVVHWPSSSPDTFARCGPEDSRPTVPRMWHTRA